LANTTYDYRVSAINGAGSSAPSNIAPATTDPVTGGTELQVGSLVVTTEGIGGGQKRGRADIVITDDAGNPVAGAMVSGTFTGTLEEEPIVPVGTDGNGLVTYATTTSAKGKVSVTFCITDVTHTTLSYLGGEACSSN
jgi:hypothetical protein